MKHDLPPNHPGIFTVYGVKGKDRFVIGTWFSSDDAIGMAGSVAQMPEHRADYTYVKEFGVGTIHHEKRSAVLQALDQGQPLSRPVNTG